MDLKIAFAFLHRIINSCSDFYFSFLMQEYVKKITCCILYKPFKWASFSKNISLGEQLTNYISTVSYFCMENVFSNTKLPDNMEIQPFWVNGK